MKTQHIITAGKQIVAYVWRIVRPVLGWCCIAFGIIGLLLPVLQGSIFLVLGVMLVGRRNRLIRWVAVHTKLLLRQWASHTQPLIRWVGGMMLAGQKHMSRQRRRLTWWYLELELGRQNLLKSGQKDA
jgi:hypothetical protein